MTVVYDIEIFTNLLLVGFLEIETMSFKFFIISRNRNDCEELFSYIKKIKVMIGFNNRNFDWPLLYYFLSLVRSKNYKRMGHMVKLAKNYANQLIKDNKTTKVPELIQQIDLRLIHHFDNKAKMTSLKQLEFFMRMENVEDLPIPHDSIITDEEIDKIIDYNKNDLIATYKFYSEYTLEHIQLREELSTKYNIDMTNFNDVKIGETILTLKLRNSLKREFLGQTQRESIKFSDIIFSYVKFDSELLNNFLDWLKSREITETKGSFSEIPNKDLVSILPILDISKDNLKRKPRKVNIESWKDLVNYPDIELKSLTINYKDYLITYGTGGVHQATYGNFISDEKYVIKSFDVAGYYPSLMIENNIYPLHLGPVFCTTMNDIRVERSKYPKGTSLNKALKLSGNGSYGKMNDKYSELRDPQAVMQITLNGQLLLTMLVEKLLEIEGCKLLMMNTDGGEIIIPRNKEEEFFSICKQWEELTRMVLEHTEYKELHINNVNNYISIYMNGNLKQKGAYEYKKDPHKNHSMLVVPKAVEAYYKNNTPIEEFIVNHKDVFDFFKLVVLKDKNHNLISRCNQEVVKLTKVTRYIVSREGKDLVKIMPPLSGKDKIREEFIERDRKCTVYNNLQDVNLDYIRDTIDYDYYIQEAKKLII